MRYPGSQHASLSDKGRKRHYRVRTTLGLRELYYAEKIPVGIFYNDKV
jgi:hypothetical protein